MIKAVATKVQGSRAMIGAHLAQVRLTGRHRIIVTGLATIAGVRVVSMEEKTAR